MKNRIKSLLRQPVLLPQKPKVKIVFSLTCGLLVFLFLTIFKPTNLHTLTFPELLLLAFINGAISVVVLIFVFFILQPVLFKDKNNYYRLIIWSLSTLFLIAHVILLSNIFIHEEIYRWVDYFVLVLSTVSTGTVIMIMMVSVYNFHILRKHINSDLLAISKDIPQIVTINAQNSKKSLKLKADSLLYIESFENYVKLYSLDDSGQVKSFMIRSTMKNIENTLKKTTLFWRCHRCFIVNTRFIEEITPVKQGFQLRVQKVKEIIPVSRSQNQSARNYTAMSSSIQP